MVKTVEPTELAVYSQPEIDGEYRLELPYRFMDGEFELLVGEGFRWDGASVPRLVWTIISPSDLGAEPPLIHDWLYRSMGNPTHGKITPSRTYTRSQADSLFLRHMKLRGVSWWRRNAAYAVVRAAAGGSWRIKTTRGT